MPVPLCGLNGTLADGLVTAVGPTTGITLRSGEALPVRIRE